MPSLKIVITLLVLITLGIIVGSNLISTMTVTFLNQPTITLPTGIWLAIAIGLGLLSSSTIQILLAIERRLLDRQISRLQSRLQQEEDIFTYTSESPQPVSADSQPRQPLRERVGVASPVEKRQEQRVSDESTEPSAPKRSIFSSYRTNFANNFRSQPATKPIIVDDLDDWEAEPVAQPQLDWDDVELPRQQKVASPTANFAERSYASPQSPTFTSAEPNRRNEVYDADFRLIQPPYREPSADELDEPEDEEYLEDADIERDEYSDFSRSATETRSKDRASSSKYPEEDDEDDWGFDFEEEDISSKNSKSRNRKF